MDVLYKILIIEDDRVITKSIASHLEKWNYRVEAVVDFKNIMERFDEFKPHLVVLDISLPYFNGYHWCNEIRRVSEVPIIFISSSGDDMNIVMAMDMGGDDFIVKPFDLKVLLAKMKALLRRTYSFASQIDTLNYKGLVLNLENACIIYEDREVELTRNEFKILKILMENKEKIISRNKLMVELWESESFIDDNTLTVNIARIRKKLKELDIKDLIKTKKGLGYMVELNEKEQ